MATNQHRNVDFSDHDRLLLQQLLTRQSLAERRASQSPNDDSDEGDAALSELSPTVHIEVPQQWRLLSDKVVLHDWQRDCLAKWLTLDNGTVKLSLIHI